MSSSQNIIKYVKHNKVRLKTGETKEKTSRVLLEFFKEIEKKPTGMKGFMIMDDLQDQQESIVLTFWEEGAYKLIVVTCNLELLTSINAAFARIPKVR
jgi:hypothetical protein